MGVTVWQQDVDRVLHVPQPAERPRAQPCRFAACNQPTVSLPYATALFCVCWRSCTHDSLRLAWVTGCRFATASAFGKPWLQTEWTALQQLRQAVAVLQHHDAVTGTEGAGLSPQTTPGHVRGGTIPRWCGGSMLSRQYPWQVGNIVAWYTQLLNDGTTAAQAVAKASVAYLLSKQQHTEEMPAFSSAVRGTTRPMLTLLLCCLVARL